MANPTTPPPPQQSSIRETIESIVVAFVLAFLFRTFEAEAFVIPTGSMAPTLMGRHKDLECKLCGFPYRSSASEEVDEGGTRIKHTITVRPNGKAFSVPVPVSVATTVCPNCRFPMKLVDQKKIPEAALKAYHHKDSVELPPGDLDSIPTSFNGDRIVVAKFPFEFDDPNRWDVTVFKYPEGAKDNYIKRLVGLPNETVFIHRGDIHTCEGRSPFPAATPDDRLPAVDPVAFEELRQAGRIVIQRKPPAKVRAMLQTVYDHDYVVPSLVEAGWPSRFASDDVEGLPAFSASEDLKSYEVKQTGVGLAWLHYQHVPPPRSFDWTEFGRGRLSEKDRERAVLQLITDFYGYNAGTTTPVLQADSVYPHWVGDLAVSCQLDVESSSGELWLELIEAGRAMTCRIDVQTGKAQLAIEGLDDYQPAADTDFEGPGTYRVLFANVDDRLMLWLDDDLRGDLYLVEFNSPTEFGPLGNTQPTQRDLSPASIGSQGLAMRASHLRIDRDIYYVATRGTNSDESALASWEHLSDPSRWHALAQNQPVQFELRPNQFLLLGDNSPRSKDSRLWNENEKFVHRDLLIGKAIYVYWPHALQTIPGTGIYVPFFPNFGRMGWIR